MAKKVAGGLGGMFKTGESASKRAAKQQAKMIAEQQKKEKLRLAEEEDAAARPVAEGRAGKAGRRSLIRTSEVGLQNRQSLG